MSQGTVVEKRITPFLLEARTASATSGTYSLPSDADHVGIAVETTAYTSGTFVAKIQHSLTGEQWVDVAGATTTGNAVGMTVGFASTAIMPMIRVVLTGATTPIATQIVSVIYG